MVERTGVALSLICPTIGRSSLAVLLLDVVKQLQPQDEFIVVGDGPLDPYITKLCGLYPTVRYLETPTRVGDYGCTPCDLGIKEAKGDFLWFIGDDDSIPEGAVDSIRQRVVHSSRPHIFAMQHTGRILSNSVQACEVSGQQIVVPNNKNRIPRMADFPPHLLGLSDWVFISKVIKEWEVEGFEYHPEIICVLPTMNQGKFF